MKLPTWATGKIAVWSITGAGVLLVLGGAFFWYTQVRTVQTPEESSDDVAHFVTAFGKEIESVPLNGSAEEAKSAMEILYVPYVSRELLNTWEADLAHAPGKHTSNPRQVGIRVSSVQNDGIGSYVVKGYIIEETKTETGKEKSDGAAVLLGITKKGTSLQITEYQEIPVVE